MEWQCASRLQGGGALLHDHQRLEQTSACSCRGNGRHVRRSYQAAINSCLLLVRRTATLHRRDAKQIIVLDLERIIWRSGRLRRVSVWYRAAEGFQEEENGKASTDTKSRLCGGCSLLAATLAARLPAEKTSGKACWLSKAGWRKLNDVALLDRNMYYTTISENNNLL